MSKHKPPELRVVLDTNALYTGSANYFIRKEVADLIGQHKDVPDLQVSWYLPSIVKDERHFQMLTEAQRFLEPIGKLERLLGHNLNITLDLLDARVREAIDKQIADHGLTILPFDPATIDWVRLVSDAAFRRAPFQAGEKEKGFRDALVLESFIHLVDSSPGTPSSCRIGLVSGVELLRIAAAARTTQAQNVHVLESIDALKGLINTLGSAVDEQFIGALQPRAAKLFYKPSDKDTLYYRWDVHQQLKTTLAATTISLPAGASRYTVDEWRVSTPRFLKKQSQRVSWVSRFGARLKAFKPVDYSSWYPATNLIIPGSSSEQSVASTTSQPSNLSFPTSFKAGNLGVSQSPEGSTFFTPGLLSFPEQQPLASGTANIDVTWTVSVTTKLTLKSPQLDGLAFVDVIWEQ